MEATVPDWADTPVRVTDLSRATGVSVRTVHRAFRRHCGALPMSHLRRARLERVRHHLLTAMPGESVTSVATDWGFFHLGRFAAFYKRCFGERPSETLRRGRARQAVQPAA